MASRWLAGVDGGATKTRAVVLDGDGVARGTAIVASSSAYHREPEEAADIVIAAARAALADAGTDGPLAALGAGLAGADDPEIHDRLGAALRASGLAAVVLVDHDAAAALAGGTALEPGIVVIAGTGAVAFGIDASGRRARADGWGPLLGDDGSGYAIGRAVLRAALRAYDGRGAATTLTAALERRFGIESLARVKIITRRLAIDEIAALAPLALNCAQAGDTVATRILRRAGERLGASVAAVAGALGWRHEPFPLVTVGGVFAASEYVTAPMLDALARHGRHAEWRPARLQPEVGAALLAARAAGLDVPRLITRLDAATRPDEVTG